MAGTSYPTISLGSESFDEARRVYAPATAKVVERVLDRYLPEGRLLEIGSGMGFLANDLLPARIAKRVQQSDFDAEAVAANRATNSSSNIVVCDAGDLEGLAKAGVQAEGGFDGVVALYVFDIIKDLRKALDEVYRVLKPGGKVVHFLDASPDFRKLLEELRGLSEYMVFPASRNEDNVLDGVFLIPREAVRDLIAMFGAQQGRGGQQAIRLDGVLRECADTLIEYCRVYDQDYDAIIRAFSSKVKIIKDLAIFLRGVEANRGAPFEYVSFQNYFERKLREIIAETKFKLLKCGVETDEDIVSASSLAALPAAFRGNNVLRNIMGRVVGTKDEGIPDGLVKVVSDVHVMVAGKRKREWWPW